MSPGPRANLGIEMSRKDEKFALVPEDTFDISVFARDCRNLVFLGYAVIVIGMAGFLIYLIAGQPTA